MSRTREFASRVRNDGEAVEITVPTGPLTPDLTVVIDATDVEAIYTDMRRLQLGTDTRGDL